MAVRVLKWNLGTLGGGAGTWYRPPRHRWGMVGRFATSIPVHDRDTDPEHLGGARIPRTSTRIVPGPRPRRGPPHPPTVVTMVRWRWPSTSVGSSWTKCRIHVRPFGAIDMVWHPESDGQHLSMRRHPYPRDVQRRTDDLTGLMIPNDFFV